MAYTANVIDIRSDHNKQSLKQALLDNLERCPPSFPSLLLWDEEGLKKFEAVTHAKEYYLTNAEIELLMKHSKAIVRRIVNGSLILELGSGCLRKTRIILQALEDEKLEVDYYALDLDENELTRTLRELQPQKFRYVRCHGLVGTFENGLTWLGLPVIATRPSVVMSLGSTLGSMTHTQTAQFLKRFADKLGHRANGARKHPSLMLIGLDCCMDDTVVWKAYNDAENANERFIRNILVHANHLLGQDVFDQVDWTRHGQWNDKLGRHEQYLTPKRDIKVGRATLEAGKKMLIVSSHKYNENEVEELWRDAQLFPLDGWRTSRQYGLFIVSTQENNSEQKAVRV